MIGADGGAAATQLQVCGVCVLRVLCKCAVCDVCKCVFPNPRASASKNGRAARAVCCVLCAVCCVLCAVCCGRSRPTATKFTITATAAAVAILGTLPPQGTTEHATWPTTEYIVGRRASDVVSTGHRVATPPSLRHLRRFLLTSSPSCSASCPLQR